MTRDKVVHLLDAYLQQGWQIHSLGGGAGADWRELRILLRRPLVADHTHDQVIGGRES